MKTHRFAPFSVIFLFHGTCFAEEDQKRKVPHEKPRMERPVINAWKKADANQDGKLSFEEFVNVKRVTQIPTDKQKLLFERLDKNSNGSIEPNELQMMPDQEARPPMVPNLREIDTNQDMQVSFEEFAKSPVIFRFPEERQRKIFEKLDRNGDGFLSPKDRPEEMRDRPFFPKKDGDEKRDQPNKAPLRDMRQMWQEIDTNQDDQLDFAEFAKAPMVKMLGEDAQEDRFELIDKNSDQFISRAEWQEQPKPNFPSRPERPHRGLRPFEGAPRDMSENPEMMEE